MRSLKFLPLFAFVFLSMGIATAYAQKCETTVIGEDSLVFDVKTINAKGCDLQTINFIHPGDGEQGASGMSGGDMNGGMMQGHMNGNMMQGHMNGGMMQGQMNGSTTQGSGAHAHTPGVMHNLVIAESKDVKSILAEGLKAGSDKDFLNSSDPRIIAHTKMLNAGQDETIKVDIKKLKKGVEYTYFCTFPGHTTMLGKLVL